MVSNIADLYQQQPTPWVEPLNNRKLSRSTTVHDLHPCRYNEDLGSDDSDPESQTSESTSQDSYQGHSPATSYSSEESRADQQQNASESQFDTWPKNEILTSGPNSHLTCRVPFRPKPELSLHQTASEHAFAASQQATQNDLSNALCQSFQNPRRGRSTGATIPPTLRRDTEATDGIVRMIVFFCTNLINSIWCTNGQAPVSTASSQHGNVLPLHVFITETLRRSKTSYSTLQIALYYLILLKQCLPVQTAADKSGCRAMQCGRRMFLTSLILASKYLQDRNYSARAWSKISGLPLKEINENERRFLSIVSWDLHVPKSTFENWSKIVLQVCRRSQEVNGSCRSPDGPYSGPSSGPTGSKQCLTPMMDQNNRNWWLVSLRQLKTDVVRCGMKTQKYVESLCPFKHTTPVYRSVSPESDTCDDTVDNLADFLVGTPATSRQPSLDRSSKRFEPVPDLLHPAAPLAMPPQPTLKNLPTPLTTPQSNVQNYWTPRLAHQNSNSSLRCKASASALGSAFRKHCPIANLETCPPPPPRVCDRAQQYCGPTEHMHSSSTSVVSSPESTVSDSFSVAARSRSSSISSTSSWAPPSSHASDLRTFVGNQKAPPQLALRQPTLFESAPRFEQTIERPQTAFKIPQSSQGEQKQVAKVDFETKATTEAEDESYHSDESKRKQQEAAQILAGLCVDTSAVRSRARPTLSRSGTQIYNPCQEQDPKTQQLKRSRSDTFEFPSSLSCPQMEGNTTPSIRPASDLHPNLQRCWNPLENTYKRVQQPTECWAQPRKPYQTGPHNKRLALQVQPGSFAAAELAGRYLKTDVFREMNRPGSVVH